VYIVLIGIAITETLSGNDEIIASDLLTDYSYINATDITNGTSLIARCVTGLGPTGTNNNNALGGWYFNESRIPNRVCANFVVQPNGATTNNFVGVINLFQCGTFTTTGEGVYTCTMMNSSVMNQSMRLGVYFAGRSK